MKNIKLKNLLISYVTLFFIITGLIYSIYIYRINLKETTEIVSTLYTNQNEYQMQSINQYLNKIESLALTIKTSELLHKSIDELKTHDFKEKYLANQEMNRFLSELSYSSEEIAGIIILTENLSVYKIPKSFGFYNTNVLPNTFLTDQISSSDISGYTATFNNTILQDSYYKKIFAYYEKVIKNGEHLATICILVDSNHLSEVIQSNNLENLLLLKDNGSVIYPVDNNRLLDKLHKDITSLKNLEVIQIENSNYMFIKSSLRNGLRLVNLIPINRIFDASSNISKRLLLGFIVSCSLFTFFITIFSNSIAKSIKKIIHQMNVVGTTKDIETESLFYIKEINDLNSHFHKMNDRIINLMNQVKDEQKAISKTKIDLLKAQINPHFIYNTLDTINWMAINVKAYDISEMVSNLANLFRYSLNKGKNFTSINNELEHIRIYLSIQKYRHSYPFSYTEKVDTTLLNYFTLNMILQPIIENCLVHGFRDDNSIVNISLTLYKTDDNNIKLIITDDGIGCNESLLNGYISSIKYTSQGYGVKNINDRIRLNFGSDYGVKYNKIDIGTEVEITLPMLNKIPNDKED